MLTNTHTKLRLGLSLISLFAFNLFLAGQASPATVTVCDDYDPCTIDIRDHCGNCFHIRVDCDDLVCDDHDPCTRDILDVYGNCHHIPKVCDDGNPATIDYCNAWGVCQHDLIDCDDDDPETYDYVDSNGHCQHVREVCCDDGNPCTEDIYDPYTGDCQHVFLCDDDDPCTIDVCNPATGECWNTPKNCDDGNPCTIDYCDPYTGECVHEPKDCDDGDPCTIDSCNPYNGHCVHTPDPDCNPCYGVDCDDNNPCTYDYCNPHTGLCVHVPIDCDDGDPCTIDYCDPYTGQCVHEVDPWCNGGCAGVNCDDGDPCTVDYCNPNTGECIHVSPYCNDYDPCTFDSCDPYTGECVHTPNPACENPICGFTQGFWGNPGGMFGGQTTGEILDDILFNNPLVVGKVGQRSLTVTHANRACIFDLLPGGGPSGPLPVSTGDVSVTTPNCSPAPIPTASNGSLNNTLLAQTITLSLNIKFDPGTGFGTLPLQYSCVNIGNEILDLLPYSPDVNDLLDLANKALAGTASPDYGTLAWVISEINETYNGCNFPCLNNPLSEENSSGTDTAEEQPNRPSQDDSNPPQGERQYDFKLFPNPSSHMVLIDLKAYAGKKVHIQVFNALGQSIEELQLPAIPDDFIQLNVAGFTNGLYFMKVKMDGVNELTREFVVSHK